MSAARPPEGIRSLSDPPADAARLVLVRHGQGDVNVEGRIGGAIGCTGLTEVGRAQARALAARLAETKEIGDAAGLYASTLPRAIETAELIRSGLGLEADVIESCDLCELHPGEADNMIWEDFAATYGVPDWDVDPTVAIAPGGESWTEFVGRASGALAALAQRHRGERIVIATHAGVIESSILAFLHQPSTAAPMPRLRLRTQHASLTEWEFSDEGWRLLRYNDAAHLAALG
jgi:broad specificity phosphatase PhoE